MTQDNPVKLGDKLFFYGPPKIGLTTFAQEFTNAHMVCFNNPHLSKLKVKSSCIETMDEFRIWFKEAYNNQERTTYVFDTFDGFQDVIASEVSLKAGVEHINCKDYASGFFDATQLFKKILKTLDMLISCGHSLVFLGHSTTIPYKTIDMVDTVRHIPFSYIKNHKGEDVSTHLCNWVDGIFFVNICDRIDNPNLFTNEKMNSIDRWIYPIPSPFFSAGNRLGLNKIEALDAKSLEYWINYNKGQITI